MTTGDRLSDRDALIWRIEGDPVLRSPVVVVGLLDRAPAWPRVRSDIAAAADAVPRLRQRLAPGGFGGRPRWVAVDDFAVEQHVRRVRAADGGGLRAVLDLAEPDVTAAFDPARPLWQVTLVEGLEGGRAAFVLRFHHAITDGVGAVGLATRLLTTTRRGGPGPGPDDPPEARPAGGPTSALGIAGGAATAALALARRGPLGLARTGLGTARSVGRILAPAREPLSPVLVGRGLDRRLHTLEVPLAGLRGAAQAVGGTVNDVFLAAVGGALRSYHQALGRDVGALRITMPISVRRAGDGEGGNRFAPVRFVLPVDDPDPALRAAIAGAIVRRWRAEPAVGLTGGIAAVLDRLPAPIVQRAFGAMLRSVDADVVDVPGLRRRHYLAGASVDRLWAFAPPTGAALSVTLLSHGDQGCIALACDRAAVGDPELLATCLERAIDEVLELAGAGDVVGAPT